MSGAQVAFVPSSGDRVFHAEILSDVMEYRPSWIGAGADGDEIGFDERIHPYAVVLTQDCDLEQDARVRLSSEEERRQKENTLLDNVLLVVASGLQAERPSYIPTSKDWDVAKRNKNERYHFLSPVPKALDTRGIGIPPLLLDFKRLFTVPIEQLLGVIQRGTAFRRARLVAPYAEHLATRYGYFAMRIALPVDHHDLKDSG